MLLWVFSKYPDIAGSLGMEPMSRIGRYLRIEQFMLMVSLFAGRNTGLPSC